MEDETFECKCEPVPEALEGPEELPLYVCDPKDVLKDLGAILEKLTTYSVVLHQGKADVHGTVAKLVGVDLDALEFEVEVTTRLSYSMEDVKKVLMASRIHLDDGAVPTNISFDGE